jgi:peptide deformylase
MILPIVQYGHPALRSKGRPIDAIDDRIRKLAGDMIDTMNAADGVGLAAQQVGLSLQLCIVDVTDAGDRAGTLTIDGTEAEIDDYMPMILINPEVKTLGETGPDTEGCLSFPGLQGQITRPLEVKVTAKTLENETLTFNATGLLARAIQHEHDHLHGILFIDRMLADDRAVIAPEIDKLMHRNAM